VQHAVRDLDALYRAAPTRLDRPDVLAGVFDSWDFDPKITQKYWADTPAEKQRLKGVIVALHQHFRAAVVIPWLTRWRQYVYRLGVSILTRAREYAAAERRRLNTLNYSDLLILTAKMLRRNGDARRALQRKYRHLFVDEFQDTDPVQAEIVFLLAARESESGLGSQAAAHAPADTATSRPRRSQRTPGPMLPGLLDVCEMATPIAETPSIAQDWRTVPLRPGALFVVGDPKQSIYRFRRADIDIYNIVRDRLGATGRVLPLTMNFRSAPALCEWANGVFRNLFPTEPTQHAPKFAALVPKDEEGAAAPVKAGLSTLTYGGSRDGDAERIAAYIRSEVDAGRRRFKDFLILTRKKKDRIAPYASALEAQNVPIEVSGAGAFGDSVEVAALANLLRALADPQDPIALVAVLRGPLFGISDPELFAHRQSGGWFRLRQGSGVHASRADADDEVGGDAGGRPGATDRVAFALATLGDYYRWTRVLPAGAALERMLEATGYLALASTTPGGVEAGDLLHAVDRVRQVVEDGGSLADAADALEDAGAESNEVESLPLEPGRADVVRVMNLHKAKGLEADVVFLADPTGGVRTDKVDVHVRRDGDRALGWFELWMKFGEHGRKTLGEHADWPQHEAAERPYLAAEEHRLLYVAATRARHMLVVSRFTGSGSNSAWGALNDHLGDAQELPVPDEVVAHEPEPQDTAPQLEATFIAQAAAAHEAARAASWSISAVTAETRHVTRITRSADATADDPTKVVGTDTAAHRADAGMAWGTLMHGLLEHAMRYPNATREDLHRLALWLTVEEPQLRRSLDDAIETVLRVAKAPFWREVKAGEHYEEAPFIYLLRRAGGRRKEEGGSSHGTEDRAQREGCDLVTGVIDLLYGSPEGWRVRDYKTDVALLPEAYAGQLKAYCQALEAMEERVVDAELVHVREAPDAG
jgi:ATP-dependent helicase/nuclease subunit A